MSEEKPADPAAEGAPAEGEEAQVDGYGGGAGSRIESSRLRPRGKRHTFMDLEESQAQDMFYVVVEERGSRHLLMDIVE